jgi:hypothetical protein
METALNEALNTGFVIIMLIIIALLLFILGINIGYLMGLSSKYKLSREEEYIEEDEYYDEEYPDEEGE